MNALLHQLRISLKLHFRNSMALIYGYAFPTIFLVAFWVLYRYDRVPLVRHMGELLTVTVLGGACFGLPTTMVSERERGVWRRIRLAPVSTLSLVGSTVAARYVLLLLAGLLQVALAMGVGMPLPRHPLQLFVAFSCVAFAFMGLGLVIATLADNVPAVQALGQCIFLPMLIIGGVAVPLTSLPDWAQHLSAFFPGRYAVDALQASVNGAGLMGSRFSLLALIIIGGASALAGARLFRWDAQQRFLSRGGKGWVAASLVAWAAVGVLAEARGHVAVRVPPDTEAATAVAVPSGTAAPVPASSAPAAPAPPAPPPSSPQPVATAAPGVTAAPVATPPPPQAPRAGASAATPPEAARSATERATPVPKTSRGTTLSMGQPKAPPIPQVGPSTWQAVTMKNIDDDLEFSRLPNDGGVVTPVASMNQTPDPDVQTDLDALAASLPTWAPGKVADPVQRVRNYLYVASVVDVFQLPTEPFVPLLVFERIQAEIPKDDLIKILYWIAVHPDEGDDSAIAALRPLGVPQGSADVEEVRGRAGAYAVKLLGRITGKRPGK
jgi:hypothetical protein